VLELNYFGGGINLNIQLDNLEQLLFDFIDQIKILLVQDTWDTLLMNCTKNELLVMMILYRESDVNMTQIAEHLNVPLNTATGIVSRMEKKELILRLRSVVDKRIVTILLTSQGKEQLNEIINTFIVYGQKILTSLTTEEINLFTSVIGKVMNMLQEVDIVTQPPLNSLRKITIE
jgi:DNA-binding MarR family transcriptional regulator